MQPGHRAGESAAGPSAADAGGPSGGHDAVLAGVGPRLRALRRQRGLTLDELCATTGISASTLSRLEAGRRRPTLELLLPLARVHHVPLDELVDAPPTGDPRVHAKPLQRHGSTFIPLTRRPGGIRAYKQIMPMNWPVTEPERGVHEGREWVYVLSGQVRLLLGDQDLTLREGEVAEFDTRLPHYLGNPGPHPAELLNLYGPQGEQMHVRARPRPT